MDLPEDNFGEWISPVKKEIAPGNSGVKEIRRSVNLL